MQFEGIPTRQNDPRHPEGRCDASVFFSSLAGLRDLVLRRRKQAQDPSVLLTRWRERAFA